MVTTSIQDREGQDLLLADLRRAAGPMFATMQLSGMAMVVTNPRLPDNPIVFANDAFLQLTGYAREEVLDRNCRFLQTRDTSAEAIATLREGLGRNASITVDLLNARKDGSTFWNRLFVAPIPDVGGTPEFFFATQVDISGERMARVLADEIDVKERQLVGVGERLKATLDLSGAAAEWDWDIARSRITGDASFANLYRLDLQAAVAGVEPAVFFSIIHPADRPRIQLAVGAMLRGAEVFGKEFRILTTGGSVRWIKARGRTRTDAHGEPAHFSGVMLDVTEQKIVEEQLRIAQSAGGIGTFSYLEGFATASVSSQFCRLLGLQPAHELPITTINRVSEAGQPRIIDTTSSVLVGPSVSNDIRITRPDNGESRWLARRGEFVQDSETAGLRFVGVVYDVTDSKRREVQLREFNEELERRVEERTRNLRRSEARASAYFNLSPEYLLLSRVGADGGVTLDDVNSAAETFFGISRATSRGQPAGSVFNAEIAGSMEERSIRAVASGAVQAYQVTRKYGPDAHEASVAVSVALVERHADGGGLVLFSARDVTEQRRIEEQLRQSQKMEAVGQLTGGLAHDFNNLLAGVSGSLELMAIRLRQGRTGELERYMAAAQGATRRAAALTHRLLAFSRRQTLEPKTTDVNRLVAGLEDLIRRTVGPSIALEVVGTTGLWTALVDPPQLENALLNLCINARDAMPHGGRITVETHNKWIDEHAARERDMTPGQYLSLSVTDTGTGMLPDVIAKAFDPFFTTKPIGEGTGLGLSMIYGFARQSGGQVRIYSEIGQGTTVCVYLPRHYGTTLDVPVAVTGSATPHAGSGETVLIVDDEPTVRMLVVDVLEDIGYVAIEASDSASGLKILQSDARIDLLITDVGLPGGLNGRQMADAGRMKRPDLKVLFITGYAENAVLGHGHLAPGMQVLTKPFVVDALGARIKALVSS